MVVRVCPDSVTMAKSNVPALINDSVARVLLFKAARP
jgi:hypothetical protein